MHLFMLPILYVISKLLIVYYQQENVFKTSLIRFFTIFSGIYIIISGMLPCFIAFHNPHNSLTFFMVSLLITSIIFVFEMKEILVMIFTLEVVYYILSKLFQISSTDFVYNQLACIALLTGFCFICRYTYAYKAKSFLQLEQIEQKNSELKKAGNFKNEVLGMVAHDLRNPIAAIESIASLMQAEDHDQDTEENLSMIKKACVKAREIVNDLLIAARDENGEDLVTTVCNVNDLLEKSVNDWKNQHPDKKLKLISTDEQLYAQLNIEKFTRVLDNLISNAIKFSDGSKDIEICFSERKNQLIIEVKDYGIGIPKHLLPYVFDRFSKSSRQGLQGEKSTGLGLNISKRIAEKHNGTLEVESEEGNGCVFRITLPKTDASFMA